jgi:hypothetical protein
MGFSPKDPRQEVLYGSIQWPCAVIGTLWDPRTDYTQSMKMVEYLRLTAYLC